MAKQGTPGKQKNKTPAKKRLRITGAKKVLNFMVEKAAHNHLLLQKSSRQKTAASKPISLNKGLQKVAKRLLPNGL